MKNVNFDTKGMTNDCPLMRDRSFYNCTDCHHFVNFNNPQGGFRVLCNFPGVRGRLRTWLYKVNQWVDEDSVTYKALEMSVPAPGSVVVIQPNSTDTLFSARYVEDAIAKARDLAKQRHCNFLDINCPKGSGGRKVIVLR